MRALLSTTALFSLAALAVTACGADDTETDMSADAGQIDDGTTMQEEERLPDQPVQTGPPNVPEQTPAFEAQTRAPERISGVELSANKIANFDEPWGFARLPDGAWLVTEREGNMYLVTGQDERSEPLSGIPEVDNRDQGGLLDIAISPNFDTDRMVYFAFSEPRGDNANGTSLARGRLSDDRTGLEAVEVIFQQMPAWESTKHYGNNIEFTGNGTLYLTLGERSLPEPRQLSQDLSTHLGKVVHLNLDGTPAEGNPYIGDEDALPEIWSYGHRNMQGAAIHPETGALWTIEHGPRGGDEINVPQPGENYGWPVITYGEDYDGTPIGEGITKQEGMEQPIYFWDPVIAPGDMIFYQGDALAEWQGDLLIASLRPGAIVRLELDGQRVTGEERLLTDLGRIRDIDTDAQGNLYILTDEDDGGLYRVVAR